MSSMLQSGGCDPQGAACTCSMPAANAWLLHCYVSEWPAGMLPLRQGFQVQLLLRLLHTVHILEKMVQSCCV